MASLHQTSSSRYAPVARLARLLSSPGEEYVVVAVHPSSDLGRKGIRYAVQRRDVAEKHGFRVVTAPLPNTTRKGGKRYDFDGLSGCVTRRVSRATGTLVGVYHAAQAGMEDDPETPWMAVCEEHDTLVGLHTLSAAMASTDPREWCDDCRAVHR